MLALKSFFTATLVLSVAGCATSFPEVTPAFTLLPLAELERATGVVPRPADNSTGPRVIVSGVRHMPRPEVMGEFTLSHKCSKLMPGTQHVPSIAIDLLVRHEESLGNTKVSESLGLFMRSHHAEYCAVVGTRTLAELMEDSVVPGYTHKIEAELPPGIISLDLLSLRVEFPEEFLRALALKAIPNPTLPKPIQAKDKK